MGKPLVAAIEEHIQIMPGYIIGSIECMLSCIIFFGHFVSDT